MRLIRCTGKLQKEMGLAKSALTDTETEAEGLLDWHANLFNVDRRKCVLFTNDRTLLNFIALDVRRAEIRELSELFRAYLGCVLSAEDLPSGIVERILGWWGSQCGGPRDRPKAESDADGSLDGRICS